MSSYTTRVPCNCGCRKQVSQPRGMKEHPLSCRQSMHINAPLRLGILPSNASVNWRMAISACIRTILFDICLPFGCPVYLNSSRPSIYMYLSTYVINSEAQNPVRTFVRNNAISALAQTKSMPNAVSVNFHQRLHFIANLAINPGASRDDLVASLLCNPMII